MKIEQIYEWINEISEMIPHFFENEECIKKHLDAFVIWNDIEWFNIALILYQRPDATIVNSKNAWTKLTGKEFFIKLGEKGIRVIIPYLIQKKITWKSAIVWDVDQCQDRLEVGIVSKLKICVEELFSRNLYEGKDESDELIKYIMMRSKKYIHTNLVDSEDITDYIRKCIIYVLSSYIPIDQDDIKLESDHLMKDKATYLYYTLKTIIGKLDCFLFDYYTEKNARIKVKAEIQYAKKIWNMTIHERIEDALESINNNDCKHITEDNNEDYDFEEPTGEERRIL